MASKFKPAVNLPLNSSLTFRPTSPVRNEDLIDAVRNCLEEASDVALTSRFKTFVTMQHDLVKDVFTVAVDTNGLTFSFTHINAEYAFKMVGKQLWEYHRKLNAKIDAAEQAKFSAPRKKSSSGPRGKGAAGKRRS